MTEGTKKETTEYVRVSHNQRVAEPIDDRLMAESIKMSVQTITEAVLKEGCLPQWETFRIALYKDWDPEAEVTFTSIRVNVEVVREIS